MKKDFLGARIGVMALILCYQMLWSQTYPVHHSISSTVFWVGEKASEENGEIPNLASVWDDMWMEDYGGVDDPDDRAGYRPRGFAPRENPFYVALPYNDFNAAGKHRKNLKSYIPWVKRKPPKDQSVCKNRWVEIKKKGKTVYAQWEDSGPFGEDDIDYVFGNARPKNRINNHAGIDVSPAVRDYLGLDDVDTVDWRFVDGANVPKGPWKRRITRSQVNWVDWYRPDLNASFQWQLQGKLNTSIDAEIYDVDLFDTSKKTILRLKRDGHRVICYFSAGSWEDWRRDAHYFPEKVKGEALDGWEGERWLDIRRHSVWRIMRARIALARRKGCDGVEPDNVDGYQNETGFDLTARQQSAYNRFLARAAHKRGLSVALKNDLDQVEELVPFFDFALNEQCHQFNECDLLDPFVEAGKPVFNVEYAKKYVQNSQGARTKMCRDARERGFYSLVLPRSLDGSFRISCDKNASQTASKQGYRGFLLSAYNPPYAWNYEPPYKDGPFRYYKNAHFDTLMWAKADDRYLKKIHKFHLKYFLNIGEIVGEKFLRGRLRKKTPKIPEAKLKEVERIVRKYQRKKDHDLLGYYLCDEPFPSAFGNIAKVIRRIRSIDSSHLILVNLWPFFKGEEDRIDGQHYIGGDYYLEKFIKKTKIRLLLSDRYVFHEGYDEQAEFFRELIRLRKHALRHHIPFAMHIQAVGTDYVSPDDEDLDWRTPNESEHRWLVYTSVVYGVHGIVWFHWDSDWGVTGNPPNVRKKLYASIRDLNKDLSSLGKILVQLTSTQVYHNDTTRYVTSPNRPQKLRAAEDDSPIIIGWFKDRQEQENYFMLVNKDYDEEITEDYILSFTIGRLEVFNVHTGKWESCTFSIDRNKSEFKVHLDPGEGKLFRFFQE